MANRMRFTPTQSDTYFGSNFKFSEMSDQNSKINCNWAIIFAHRVKLNHRQLDLTLMPLS